MSSPLTEIKSMSSHVSNESVEEKETEYGYHRSTLWRSLYVLSQELHAVNKNTITSVSTANNPHPLRFLAILDLESQYDYSRPYFNLPHTGLDLFALKRMCTQFEVCPLDANTTDVYPKEAIKCSSTMIDMLNVLHGEAEDARNTLLLNTSVYPHDIPFWHQYTNGEEKRLSIVLTTDPLIQNIPNLSRSAMPQLKQSDIRKGDVKLSPCKSSYSYSSGGGEGSSAFTNSIYTPLMNLRFAGDDLLSSLPDPLGHYFRLITQYHLQDAVIVAPTVQCRNWVLIKPAEYAQQRDNAPPKEKNSLRHHQVMLKLMKLLLDASITVKMSHDFHLGGKDRMLVTKTVSQCYYNIPIPVPEDVLRTDGIQVSLLMEDSAFDNIDNICTSYSMGPDM
ncbi:hypothetical protein CY34DRAFT_110674 [Suillus luteus UH-Slu-Lm8-n1]|uniref:Uncharacterized protein n=1 Tax=Suillus luteus UH-Slu-Lm8-n1 TaxID=930992 RepID=A0A0C9Z705_9AGAM|nr:hypothetical protein CY34DRAFT_110674 [Suillus luteus UH-Slu-Lm8-n1]